MQTKIFISIFITLFCLPTLLIAQLADSPWPTFHHDLKRTGKTNLEGPQEPNLLWKFKTGNIVESSPAIDRFGVIYIGSYDNYLYAINRDGTLKWKFLTWDSIKSSPTIGTDGSIFFFNGFAFKSNIKVIPLRVLANTDITGDILSFTVPKGMTEGFYNLNAVFLNENGDRGPIGTWNFYIKD